MIAKLVGQMGKEMGGENFLVTSRGRKERC